MEINIIKDRILVLIGDKAPEAGYRSELTNLIIKQFGKGDYEEGVAREIIQFGLDYYLKKFKDICFTETSVRFYQRVFMFHEHATEIAYKHHDTDPKILDYIKSYRRILKFIIETGCEISMVAGEKTNHAMRMRVDPIINELLFVGNMILMFVNLFAEQDMIEDVVSITYDEDGYYVFGRKHHYEAVFNHMSEELGSHIEKSIVDTSEYSGLSDLSNALQECFGVKYEDLSGIVGGVHQRLESHGGDQAGFNWELLTENLSRNNKIPIEIAEQIFQGLRLDKNNKMDLLDLACKPYNLNRYLYRPIHVWEIEGREYVHIGTNAWLETTIQLTSNAIPWGKAAEEWKQNSCFSRYIHSKEDQHDKWLEDAFEEKLIKLNRPYERNVTSLRLKQGYQSINVEGLGEIDFIILSKHTKSIYIVDCKHLLGRYDMPNMKNDFNAFEKRTTKKKSYNETMKNKLDWMNSNKPLLIEYLELTHQPDYKISDYKIEGIFVINSPTFYMYNATYRVYTLKNIGEVLQGTFEDPQFTYVINENDTEKTITVSYPYFKKPQYYLAED